MEIQNAITRNRAWFVLACLFEIGSLAFAKSPPKADLSRLVVVGDSLSAGVQNFSLLDTQQPNGYASLIAAQAGVPLTLPLVPYPGAPNVLTLVSPGPPPVIVPAPGTLPFPPRDNPGVQATNLSIPGITVADALLTPSQIPAYQGPVQGWAEIVLAFPGPPQSQVDEALALNPTTLILWLGNNDALVPALTGQLGALTPPASFANSYNAVIGKLAASHATLITANIPDVTSIPFFTPVAALAQQTGLPLSTITSVLKVGSGDYLRSTALPIALGLLQGQPAPPPYVWPSSCPLPAPGLLPPGVLLPCVFTASDAATVRATVDSYNAAITQQSAQFGATLVDVKSLLAQVSANGYKTGGYCLNTGLLGGIFSLDGIHPTNTGYAIIANQFIDTMDANLNLKLKDVHVQKVAKSDPLVLPSVHCGSGGSSGNGGNGGNDDD